jgi:hypothetical protein
MGPACKVKLGAIPDAAVLDRIDAVLARRAEVLERTRKGRVWNVWVGGRPVCVSTDASLSEIELSAGCNSPEDYALLRRLAIDLATELRGRMTEPQK